MEQLELTRFADDALVLNFANTARLGSASDHDYSMTRRCSRHHPVLRYF